jgi:hypothetical protein
MTYHVLPDSDPNLPKGGTVPWEKRWKVLWRLRLRQHQSPRTGHLKDQLTQSANGRERCVALRPAVTFAANFANLGDFAVAVIAAIATPASPLRLQPHQ